MAMFVSRLPVGVPRSELERIPKAAFRSARAERETGSAYRLNTSIEGAMVLYLSFYFTFCWSSKTTVALALNSLWGCCNETFPFHNFLPKSCNA